MKSLEFVVPFSIGGGNPNTSINVPFTPEESGKIVGAFISTNGVLPRNGRIKAELKDTSGRPLIAMQDIKNYAQRNADYYNSVKPLNYQNNMTQMSLSIVADDTFDVDFEGELVLIYERQF